MYSSQASVTCTDESHYFVTAPRIEGLKLAPGRVVVHCPVCMTFAIHEKATRQTSTSHGRTFAADCHSAE